MYCNPKLKHVKTYMIVKKHNRTINLKSIKPSTTFPLKNPQEIIDNSYTTEDYVKN